jgi:hypothetical protein
MDVWIYFGAVVLGGLAQASLAAPAGVFTLLFHNGSGRFLAKRSRKLLRRFIIGVFTASLVFMGAICYILALSGRFGIYLNALMCAVLCIMAFFIWIFYYRRGETTEIWIPRSLARFLSQRGRTTTNVVEAFSLGIMSIVAEALMIIPLMMVVGNNILSLSQEYWLLAVIVYSLVTIIPLLAIMCAVRSNKTAVEVQRWRLRNRFFLKFISGLLFATLAIFIMFFELWGAKI